MRRRGVEAGLALVEAGRHIGEEAEGLDHLLLAVGAGEIDPRHVVVAQAGLQVIEESIAGLHPLLAPWRNMPSVR